MKTRSRKIGSRRVAGIGFLSAMLCFGLVAGCGDETSGNGSTAMRINVTVAEGHEQLGGEVHTLKFFVAYVVPGVDMNWKFDHDATGSEAEVMGRNLLVDPFRWLIREDGDGVMEMVRVFVLAFKGEELRAWGQLENPDQQQFIAGRIADRTIYLRDSALQPPPFHPIGDVMGCWYFEGLRIDSPNDEDCDGVPVWDDCDDQNGEVRPGGLEVCFNAIDDDCDGVTDEVEDGDNDGYTNCDGDCADDDNTVNPGAQERCDGKDNNCNGQCDESFDTDGDGFTVCGEFTGTHILPDGTCTGEPSEELRDCGPSDPYVYPGAEEMCDGKDNNCNGTCDEGFDQDADGWTTCGSKYDTVDATACRPPQEWAEDCNDGNGEVNPGNVEVCDGMPNNCDPLDDLTGVTQTCYAWVDEGGWFICRDGTATCDDTGGLGWSDCDTTNSSGNVDGVPDIFCDLYEECTSNEPVDPLLCMDNQITYGSAMCHVYSEQTMLTCGDPPTYPLPAPDPGITECEWYVNDTAPGWDVTLWEWDHTGGAYVPAGSYSNSCDVLLVAQPVDPTAWQGVTENVQVVFVGNQGVEITVWDVALNVATNQCNMGDDMNCTGL